MLSLVLSVLFFAAPVRVFAVPGTDVQVISSDVTGVTFVWKPENSLFRANSGKRLITRGGVSAEDGTQRRYFHLLLPNHQQPRVTVTAVNSAPLSSSELLVQDTAWVTSTELFAAEGHRVLRLGLAPAVREPAGIRQLRSITIRVDFGPGPVPTGNYGGGFPVLSRLALNWEQGAEWLTETYPPPPVPRTQISSGEAFRFTLQERGVYRLSYEDLARVTDPGLWDPRRVHIYTSGGDMLPEDPAQQPDSVFHDLPTILQDDGDEYFEPGEALVFVGQGTQRWVWDNGDLSLKSNLYSSGAVYWVRLEEYPAPRMEALAPPGDGPVEEELLFAWFRKKYENYFLDSPRYLFGAALEGNDHFSCAPVLASKSAGSEGTLKIRFYQPSSDPDAEIQVLLNGLEVGSFTQQISGLRILDFQFPLNGGTGNLEIVHSPVVPGALAVTALDYLQLVYPTAAEFYADEVFFITREQDGVRNYVLDAGGDHFLFEVSDPLQPRFTEAEGFSLELEGHPAFLMGVRNNAIREVPSLTAVQFTDLRTQDAPARFLVIAPQIYADVLQEFVDFKNQRGLATRLVTLEEIMDSFHAGLPDPVAIRNFLRYEFLKYQEELESVLLVGNGYYDYRGVLGAPFPVTMPMYYPDHLMWNEPYPLDDFFGRLLNDDFLDISVGRWQCYSARDVEVNTRKVMALESGDEAGDWNNRALFVADDQTRDGTIYYSERRHTSYSEALIRDYFPPALDVHRVFSIQYPSSYNSATGLLEKSACRNEIVNTINSGVWLVNFMGHGNNQVWTHERIFTSGDLELLHNGNRLPVFVAVTCSWADLDLATGEAFPVMLMNKPGGGAVGIIAATNWTTGEANANLAEEIYQQVNSAYTDGEFSSPALVLRLAKNAAPQDANRRLYICLGDPTHPWDYPRAGSAFQGLFTLQEEPVDTLQTLQAYELGFVCMERGDSLELPVNGEAEVRIFDGLRRQVIHFEGTENPDSLVLELDGNLLFRGRFSVSAGAIRGTFIVPRDISQSNDPASIRLFYSDPTGILGNGYASRFYLTTGEGGQEDTVPPELELFFNSDAYQPGDLLSRVFTVILVARDSSGINLTGEIGHKIQLILDDGLPLDITEEFDYDLDSHTSGRVEHLVNELDEGVHQVGVRVWDNANNLAVLTTEVELVAPGEVKLSRLVNFPNPLRTGTRFTFQVDGVPPGTILNTVIRVFTLSGRNVARLEFAAEAEGNFFASPPWYGEDRWGGSLANGVYLYQVTTTVPGGSYLVLNSQGQLENLSFATKKLSAVGKLIIGR